MSEEPARTTRQGLLRTGIFAALVALAFLGGLGWHYAGQSEEIARGQLRRQAFASAAILQGQITQLRQQAETLEIKAGLMARYGDDIRNGFSQSDPGAPLSRSAVLTQDRDRLLHEIGKLQWKLRALALEVGELNQT
ncbi:MAG: hypothetical protein ACHQ5A_08815 [Opitutales bacterium]